MKTVFFRTSAANDSKANGRTFLTFVMVFVLSSFMISCGIATNTATPTAPIYSAIFVSEERGINFERITTDADVMASPGYNATGKTNYTTNPAKNGVIWYSHPVIALTANDERIGYIADRNNSTNVMLKNTTQAGASTQQTFRSDVRGNINSRRSEIWRFDTEKGTEELLSDQTMSFSSPQVSPDGKWILVTGASRTADGIWNTNIFVVSSDGTNFTQLTYHPANDLSAIWSANGKSIYFASQRGTEDGRYNVWRMNFSLN